MKIAFITSMDYNYYKKVGRLMLGSYQKKVRFPLYVYNEDFTPKLKSLHTNMGWDLGQEYEDFCLRWRSEKKVITFAKKAFSIIHAMDNIECDRLIWLDADTKVIRDFHPMLLDWLCDEKYLSTHFTVKHTQDEKDYYSCETGFFALNTKHKMFPFFKRTYKNIYVNDQYKNLRRFYDGEVYGETVLRAKAKGAEMLELNPGVRHKTPIPRSIIAPYFVHFKAGVKDNLDVDKMMGDEMEDEI